MCIDAHEAALKNEGLGSSEIQAAVRIASTVNAVAAVLAGEKAMSGSAMAAAA